MEKKWINVVCVTKMHSGANLWHLNVSGKAAFYEEKGLIIFMGEKYSVIGTRTGLDTTCVVYMTKALETRSMYDRWDLYTDIPCEGSNVLPADIQRNAKATVERTEQSGYGRDGYYFY